MSDHHNGLIPEPPEPLTYDTCSEDMLKALADIPKHWAQPDPGTLSKLPKPTRSSNEKGHCSECGGWHGLPAVHLDYMGHADVTKALIAIDPLWTWEPVLFDPETGGPLITTQGSRMTMWGRLTVLGKTMLGVGTCPSSKDEPEKELIGDFLRNASMRFGIAVDLWSKSPGVDGDGGAGGYERRPNAGRSGGAGRAQSAQRTTQPRPASGGPQSDNDPPYVLKLADAIGKGVGYVLTVARKVAAELAMDAPRSTRDITVALAILTAQQLDVAPRDIGLQDADEVAPSE